MRSDLRDTSDTINKMIQFGTVKYGIVKQLKDRARSERDVPSDQEENENGTSLPCSPVAECKSISPPLIDDDRNNGARTEDHNHNTNTIVENIGSLASEANNTYPEADVERQEIRNLKRITPPSSPQHPLDSPALRRRLRSESRDDDDNMQNGSDGENEMETVEATNAENVDLPVSSQQSQDMEDSDSFHGKNSISAALENIMGGSVTSGVPASIPQFPNPPMTLEAIQNMQMAIAQFAAKTLANGGADNEAAMKQLAFLQQTLFNLQQQQIFQLQLIQQLQSQLALNQMKGDVNESNADEEEDGEGEIDGECDGDDVSARDEDRAQTNCVDNNTNEDVHSFSQRSSMDLSESDRRSPKDEQRSMDDSRLEEGEISKEEQIRLKQSARFEMMNARINMPKDISMALSKQDENTPLPYGSDLASSIITNHDEPPSLDGPNSLEMLQKRAQEVLDSASQGILAGNLADEFAFGKDKNGDGKNRNEPFFKHRCRYCGKVFGSDSALQIHIRSHTGERPFKCNVCGSRFTTKGNLKVHFQRHAQKFPNVPMNSTPIPEHLDKFHPPLLEQMSPETSPQHQPSMPHVPNVPVTLPLPFPPGAGFPGFPLYRPPLEILKSLGPYPGPFFGALPPMPPKRDNEQPTDLRKPQSSAPPAVSPRIKEERKEEAKDFEPLSLRIKEEKLERTEAEISVSPKSTTIPPSPPPPTTSTQSVSSVPSSLPPQVPELSMQPQRSPIGSSQPLPPPAITQATPPPLQQMHHFATLGLCGRESEMHERLPLNFTKSSPDRKSPIRSPVSIPRSPFLGPLKHEMTLLPRPHSNDNSWENFIEVSNTSETVKLKELMKNKKITDPNQCVVCDRVLSCKSALQMHYRTHTGERPFKCRICGRAFTTKGNLKTHMAVHKIRPPMRNFHQCPVCHKKYSNALVLQQHIRLHTGEPTDLTPEQIQAAEIRDFPPTMVPGSFMNPFAFNFSMPPQNGHMGSESSQGDNDDAMDCSDDFEDEDMSDHMSNGGDSDRPKSRDDMKGMLEQKLKIENNCRPKSEASTSSAPTSPVSAMNKCSPAPSDTSQGALDLTPRSSLPHPTPPPNLMPSRPPFGMFPNLPLFPPTGSATQNMCNAMNTIAQSVMPAAPFNPLALSGVRGSTTCGLCFKTFPCHSALEIHYRSHTKERPFKCSICDRGFTTKGNLKQHMLTHKIRDMEQDAFRNRAVKYMSNWKEGFE